MNLFKGLGFLFFMHVIVPPCEFGLKMFEKVFLYFSDSATQERYWTRKEKKWYGRPK